MSNCWKSKGRIFVPEEHGLDSSYASLPFALQLNEENYRIYFSGRDASNRSHPYCFDFNFNGLEVSNVHLQPLLLPGKSGEFDQDGVMLSSVVNSGNQTYFYYVGWSTEGKYPFQNTIGLAIGNDKGLQLEKYGNEPVLGLSTETPFFTASPFVVLNGSQWQMFYCGGVKWERIENSWQACYNLFRATSNDGKSWQPQGYCLGRENDGETAFARPFLFENDLSKMWYCYRGEAYGIGFAENIDGQWRRKDDQLKFVPSHTEFDSEMICYPYIIQREKRYMLYNGNGFGKTGIFLAVED